MASPELQAAQWPSSHVSVLEEDSLEEVIPAQPPAPARTTLKSQGSSSIGSRPSISQMIEALSFTVRTVDTMVQSKSLETVTEEHRSSTTRRVEERDSTRRATDGAGEAASPTSPEYAQLGRQLSRMVSKQVAHEEVRAAAALDPDGVQVRAPSMRFLLGLSACSHKVVYEGGSNVPADVWRR